jgi:hypothetical protein
MQWDHLPPDLQRYILADHVDKASMKQAGGTCKEFRFLVVERVRKLTVMLGPLDVVQLLKGGTRDFASVSELVIMLACAMHLKSLAHPRPWVLHHITRLTLVDTELTEHAVAALDGAIGESITLTYVLTSEGVRAWRHDAMRSTLVNLHVLLGRKRTLDLLLMWDADESLAMDGHPYPCVSWWLDAWPAEAAARVATLVLPSCEFEADVQALPALTGCKLMQINWTPWTFAVPVNLVNLDVHCSAASLTPVDWGALTALSSVSLCVELFGPPFSAAASKEAELAGAMHALARAPLDCSFKIVLCEPPPVFSASTMDFAQLRDALGLLRGRVVLLRLPCGVTADAAATMALCDPLELCAVMDPAAIAAAFARDAASWTDFLLRLGARTASRETTVVLYDAGRPGMIHGHVPDSEYCRADGGEPNSVDLAVGVLRERAPHVRVAVQECYAFRCPLALPWGLG